MIKEFCDICHGGGYIDTREHVENIIKCESCQGKGYTELEDVLNDIPNQETIKDFSAHFLSLALRKKKVEVYIKEVKEDTK